MPGIARLLCVVLTLLLPAAAAAHAQFEGSDPSPDAVVADPPEAVSLWFSEPVSPVAMRWISPGGESVPARAEPGGKRVRVAPPPDAGDGSYLLAWRVVSLDGHPVGGTLVISIGAPSEIPTLGSIDWPPVSTWSVIVMKFALTVLVTLGVGGAVYRAFVAGDARGRDRIATPALFLVFPAAVLLVGAQGLDLLGLPLGGLLSSAPWATGAGTSILRSAVLCAVSAGLVLTLRAIRPARHRGAHRAIVAVAWLLAAASFAVSGHTATADPEWVAAIASTLHGVAMIFWLGALVPILRHLGQGDRPEASAELRRFSALAVPLVLVLLASGVVMTTIHAGSGGFRAIAMSGYGILLFVKLVAVLGLLLIAAHNRLVLTPAFRAGRPGADGALRGAVRVEIVLALMIVAFASSFRLTPPPQSLSGAPDPRIVEFGADGAAGIAARLRMTPGRVGPNVVELVLRDAEGAPLDPVEVRLDLALPERDLGPIAVAATAAEDGGWTTETFILPLPGDWVVTLDLLVTDFDIETLTTGVTVAP